MKKTLLIVALAVTMLFTVAVGCKQTGEPTNNRPTSSRHPASIKIQGVEYSTSYTAIHLVGAGLTNEDIVPLQYMTNLNELILSKNEISDISPLAGLTSLVNLNLNNNQIIDISPLADLTNLETLYLFNNQIVDISALADLTNLQELNLTDNQVSDISALSGFHPIGEIHLSGNPVSDWSPIKHVIDVTGRPFSERNSNQHLTVDS